MTEQLVWNKRYELDIATIDLQHHYFMDLINRLSLELNTDTEPDYRISLIAELNAYVRFHFISEENFMKRSRYPGLAEHKNHHRQLLDALNNKEIRLEMHHGEDDIKAIMDFLVSWFMTHTSVEDRKFADFYHSLER